MEHARSLATCFPQGRRALLLGATLVLVAILAHTLTDLAAELRYADILAAIRATDGARLLLAGLATIASYAALVGYDACALRLAGVTLPRRVVTTTSFVAYALGNSMGVGVLTGGAVRMRMYGAAGVEAGAIAQVIASNALAFGWGVAVVGACGLAFGAAEVAPLLHLPVAALWAFAATIGGGTLAWCAGNPGARDLSVFGRTFRLPGRALLLRQLAIAALDIAAAAAALWVLLPAGAVPYGAFLGFYAIAIMAGVLSHLPGGLGVFEAVILVALRDHLAPETMAGALVLYRIVYYAIPLALSLAVLAWFELRHGVIAPFARAARSLAPALLAAWTFLIGTMLLVSGATPASDAAAALLELHVPLPLVEASHFLGSVLGLALLFVAQGMLRRLDAAWWAGLALAGASLVLAFPKGIAWSEAAPLGLLVAALLLSRRQFTRRASLFALRFTAGWLVAVGAVVLASCALMLFVYRDVAYSHELWWQFAFDGHAPRSLRAMLAVGLLTTAMALRWLLRPPAPPLAPPSAEALAQAAAIVATQDSAEAGLALTGDKHLLFADSGRAFVMFGRHGRSWIALFDPVGPDDERQELVWQFIAQARDAGGRASFYQVRPQALPLYLDAGLRAFKLGEYAQVPLAGFSLQGRARAGLRQGVNRATREGLGFAVLSADEVTRELPALAAVSDAWLARHATAEKGFSLGAFDSAYVCTHPVAVARLEGRTVAFATLLTTATRRDVTVDLMRQLPTAPAGTMDFLFAHLMLHFRDAGYERFGLGMAPLSGMATHPLATSWHRLGRTLFAHGEHFYNFRGLRAFKEKFDPGWEPRYLASPGGIAPLLVLADVAALIGGGYRRMLAK